MTISQESIFKVNNRDNIISYYNSREPYSLSTLTLYINIFDDKGKPIPDIANNIKIEYYRNEVKAQEVIIPTPVVSSNSGKEFTGVLQVKAPGLYRFILLINGERVCIGEPTANVIDLATEPATNQITGMFPRPNAGIVPYNRAINGIAVDAVEGCSVGYYSSECSPAIDSAAINGLISELANILVAGGEVYDCHRTDNVANAIYKLINSGDDRRYRISQANESVDGAYFPPIVYPNPRLTFPNLKNRLIANDTSDEFKTMLEQCKIIDHTFVLSNDDKLYLDLQGKVYLSDVYDDVSRHMDFTDWSIAVVAIDDNFTLYDTDITDPALYSTKNLGVFNIYTEQVHLKTETMNLPQGTHNVKVYIMQFHQPLFPTDVKYRENYTRLRVDTKKPRITLSILRSVI